MPMPLNALQAGIYGRLAAYAPLTAVLGGAKIYDHVPQSIEAPYIYIGEDTSAEYDTKSSNGWQMTCIIHVWDFERAGSKSIKTIMGHVYDALHKQEANITVAGFSLVTLVCEFAETFQETAIEGNSDHYYHGVMRFRAYITT